MADDIFENDLDDIETEAAEKIAAAQKPAEERPAEPPAEAEQPSEPPVKAGKKQSEEEPFTLVGAMYEGVSIVVSAIMIIALVFTFAFRLVGVSGNSMNNTLSDGDWLVVTPYYSEPKYGDIVITTKETAADGSLVKRVIAVSGDEVVVDEHDNVSVNGVALKDDAFTIKDGKRYGNLTYPVTVPDGCVMLMGDNRCGSWDSRFMEIGFQEYDFLLGKAQLRLSKNFNIYATFNIENGE